MHRLDWTDLQYVLAVARAGSLAAAARELGVNHATVLRRVARLEEAQGAKVFDRHPGGYRLVADHDRPGGANGDILGIQMVQRGQIPPLPNLLSN